MKEREIVLIAYNFLINQYHCLSKPSYFTFKFTIICQSTPYNNVSRLHEYQQSTYCAYINGMKRTYLICIPFLLNYHDSDKTCITSGARFAYFSAFYNHLI